MNFLKCCLLAQSPNEGETISSTNLKEASKPSDEDLRALMSRKTVVAFLQRGIGSSIVEEKHTTAATGGGIRKELAEEEESSSSSSSDSDSSSDSEGEDDDDSEASIKTRVEFPRRDAKISEKVTKNASKLPKGNLSQKRHKESGAKKKPSKTEPDVSTMKQVTLSKTPVGHKTSKSKARDPNVKSAPKEADQQKLASEPHLDEHQALADSTLKSDYLEEKATGAQVATTQLKAPPVAQEDKKPKPVSGGEAKRVKEARESEAVEVTSKQEEETAESTVLVMGTKGETVQEAGDQAGESSTTEGTPLNCLNCIDSSGLGCMFFFFNSFRIFSVCDSLISVCIEANGAAATFWKRNSYALLIVIRAS